MIPTVVDAFNQLWEYVPLPEVAWADTWAALKGIWKVLYEQLHNQLQNQLIGGSVAMAVAGLICSLAWRMWEAFTQWLAPFSNAESWKGVSCVCHLSHEL
jgi:hypothetical protein